MIIKMIKDAISDTTLDIKMLDLVLKKLNEKLNDKKKRNKNMSALKIDKILSINKKNCIYTGNKNDKEYKSHLEIKFTSPDENGIICLSVLLDQYSDYFIIN